jgi:signal transduction histidine kinase
VPLRKAKGQRQSDAARAIGYGLNPNICRIKSLVFACHGSFNQANYSFTHTGDRKNMPGQATSSAVARESSGQTQALRERQLCGLMAFDRHGRLTASSPEVADLLGLATAPVVGSLFSALPAPLATFLAESFGNKSPLNERQLLINTATLRAQAVLATEGGLVLVLHDLHPARRFDQHIRRLDRLANIGTLSASHAHEIKNAIVAVKTFVDLLLEKNQDAELAEVVGREMKRIDALVSQMMRAASPARTTVARVGVHAVLDHSLRLVQHTINDKLIVLRREFTTGLDVVEANADQLEQSFMNLLLNALEAMGANGELTIRTAHFSAAEGQPTQLRITFQDTGIGIPPENMERLFETFFTTKKNGTGLGLAITRRIMQEHHGEITVESNAPNGSTFHLTLPLASN